MSESRSLPDRPSLEQLRKQAKDLLKSRRQESPSMTLADAQLALAREYGFPHWPALVEHAQRLRSTDTEKFETLAARLAAAYTTGDITAIREINWGFNTGFVWYHEIEKMQQRLPRWFAAAERTPELALADARTLVAHAYGADTFEALVSARPYRVDAAERSIEIHGPVLDAHVKAFVDAIVTGRITRVRIGGATDELVATISHLDHVTSLDLGNSNQLTDEGVAHLARMPQLRELDLGGWKGIITDKGLAVLRHLPALRSFHLAWQQHVSDDGLSHSAACDDIEDVDLMGTFAGDATLRALAAKRSLRRLKTGRNVTDVGIAALRDIPAFVSSADQDTELLLDGPFTNQGVRDVAGLDGVNSLGLFWHSAVFTSEGLASLGEMKRLHRFMISGDQCDDDAMRHIGRLPRLRDLSVQDTIAGDEGFIALSQSESIESIWGRECRNLKSRGFMALRSMPSLRTLGVSCAQVEDAALSALPHFPALVELTTIGMSDDAFRHVGACTRLEKLTCMYCREIGDAATERVVGLHRLKSYYAGATRMTDRSLETLARMASLEQIELWACASVTNEGVLKLLRLPRLKSLALDGLPNVGPKIQHAFPPHVRVRYSG